LQSIASFPQQTQLLSTPKKSIKKPSIKIHTNSQKIPTLIVPLQNVFPFHKNLLNQIIMKKRTFLKASGLLAVATLLRVQKSSATTTSKSFVQPRTEPFSLPALGYAVHALEPQIDKATMEIHHGKHHAAYVKNLNEKIKGTKFEQMELLEILTTITDKDAPAIRNNAGGHFNHTMFWESLRPATEMPVGAVAELPVGALADAINKTFGSYDKFKEEFDKASKGVFGSGWAWLSVDKDKKLFISTTPNQDNPLMANMVKIQGTPLFGLDVWEHAYYLKYQNKRADYITAFWSILNWEKATERFSKL
jgi:superoxide dismutase, Fe-Mn family